MANQQFQALLEQFKKERDQVVQELSKVIVGQLSVIDQMLAAIFVRGHCLLVGVPGLAKTMMVRSLASVIQQAERFGASIVSALRVHADTLRIKRFQRAEELAQQAVVKLVFPTILCIFPALFVVLAGPAVFRIFEMFDKMAS